MTRYFKTYINSTKDVEISKAKAIKGLGLVYEHPVRVLRCLPFNWRISAGWAYYRKVKTK